MPWTVDIHHLDIGSIGDATVIDVKYPAGGGGPPIRRTVLVDGGKANAAAIVHPYLVSIGVNRVDIIIVTHFDQDHYYGISALLDTGPQRAMYEHAILYDTGRLPTDRDTMWTGTGPKRRRVNREFGNYRDRIAAMPATFRHATARVNSFDIVRWDAGWLAQARGVVNRAVGIGAVAVDYQEPSWLLGRDLMWGNGGDGLPGRLAWNVPAGPAYALNRPVLRCIAANKWVLQNNGAAGYRSTARSTGGRPQSEVAEAENENENAKSLGFVLEFNNFRYYIAGDLEEPQEDGCRDNNILGGPIRDGVMHLLNFPDNMTNRVNALKASHHGSSTASSRAFVTRLRPAAAFISSGAGNMFLHPAQRTVNVLDGYPEQPILGDQTAALRHPPQPPPPPLPPIQHYLTGYQSYDPISNTGERLGGDASQTAGAPGATPPLPGHIVLTVTEEQSQRPRVGQTHRGTRTTLEHVAAGLGLPAPATAVPAADAAATYGPIRAVATVLGVATAIADGVHNAAAWMGDGEPNGVAEVGVANAAVTAAGGGGGAGAVVTALGGFGTRVTDLGPGAAAAIAAAVTAPAANLATTISTAATGAGASAAAATAAGAAASVVFGETNGRDDAAYAVGIALRAVVDGATAAQAATITAAIMMTIAIPDDPPDRGVRMIIAAARHATLPAPLTPAEAAQAAAVGAVAYHLGLPINVELGVQEALVRAGVPAATAAPHAANARVAATLNPANTLFTVSYDSVNGPQNIAHAE
ncbi:MBL fold metallo-hydrolase [Micromonospora sp. NBC_01699]|uniref:ComEC/Rec2 family competence protein n=1 Tax=Micromonospora sp. NBC_01699 TaxID=2975984 RepID=UPI002E29462A|nr:MBL fold metallo-hydrolase [Micromonospora sp. NBC_01699]